LLRLRHAFRLAGAYLSCSKRTRQECPVWEISTQNHTPHIAMRLNPTIAWKASPTRTPPPICTSAPFPKPRWSQDPRASRTPLTDTACLISRNGNDSTREPGQSSSRSRNQTAGFATRGKRLNLRGDSKTPNQCDISDSRPNKFINC